MKAVKTSNMRRGAGLGLALLLCAGGASAQMYKWVDANGKTHFSDQPPPATAKAAPIKATTGAASGAQLPYVLAQAARNYPVTLYTTASCTGCDQGRTMLKARGIPFTEKTVSSNEDVQKLTEATGTSNLPALVVGSAKSSGFQASAWNAMLNVALYPETKILPASYQYPAPVTAAPRAVKVDAPDPAAIRLAAEQEEEKRRKEAAAKAKAPTAPPGFQF
jgi:glutaredoxin